MKIFIDNLIVKGNLVIPCNVEEQLNELKDLILEVKDLVFTESEEILERITELENRLDEVLDIDLSEEISDLSGVIDEIKAISGESE